MTALKSFTDIPQSEKLTEILPLENADMYYQYVLPKSDRIKHNPEIGNPINALEWYNKGYVFRGKELITMDEFCVPCWSLSALLGVLPSYFYDETGRKTLGMSKGDTYYNVFYENRNSYIEKRADNPIDACYEMILKLHEQNLL